MFVIMKGAASGALNPSFIADSIGLQLKKRHGDC